MQLTSHKLQGSLSGWKKNLGDQINVVILCNLCEILFRQLEIKLQKLLGFRNMQEKLENSQVAPDKNLGRFYRVYTLQINE